MSISYFILEKGIIEREDLSIYEKMCCVVLAKWASEEKGGLNTLTLAREMSCTESKANETIKQLKQKGFIESEEPKEATIASKIIKAENVEGLKPIDFQDVNINNRPMSREDLMDGVQEIIEETINDSEARIILNFAGDDLEKIKRCYKIAKKMQISDTIEALIIELQRKEKPPATLESINREASQELVESLAEEKIPIKDAEKEAPVQKSPKELGGNQDLEPVADTLESGKNIERPWYLDDDDDIDDVIKPPVTQINASMINKMKAYKRYGK